MYVVHRDLGLVGVHGFEETRPDAEDTAEGEVVDALEVVGEVGAQGAVEIKKDPRARPVVTAVEGWGWPE